MDIYQKVTAAIVMFSLGWAAGFWVGDSGARVVPTNGGAPESSTGQALSGSAISLGESALLVRDQAPGLRVDLAMVTIARDGWVVIHEEMDGKPGRILGARRVGAGAGLSVSVELLRPTEEGRVYFAMLHADDGDRAFDHTRDLPLQDAGGNVILMRFIATVREER